MKNDGWNGFLFRCGIYAGVALAFLFIFSANCFAQIYQCRDVNGCRATINTDDNLDGIFEQKKVIFRKGDVVSTDAGWIVSTDDGWVRLRPGMKGKEDEPPISWDWYYDLPPFRGLTRPWGRRSPPHLPCWAGMYRLDGYDMSDMGSNDLTKNGGTLCVCQRQPGCWALAWGYGVVFIPYGEAIATADGGWTPLFFAESEWDYWWWWW